MHIINSPPQTLPKDSAKFQLIGTHAHEAQMVFQGLSEQVDDSAKYPISALLWHMNYWLEFQNFAVLPDTLGSRSLVYLFKNLKLPEIFVDELKQKSKTWDLAQCNNSSNGGGSIYDCLMSDPEGQGRLAPPGKPKAAPHPWGAMYREDSGTQEGFAALLNVKANKLLASEIENLADFQKARGLGYFGAGIYSLFPTSGRYRKDTDSSSPQNPHSFLIISLPYIVVDVCCGMCCLVD